MLTVAKLQDLISMTGLRMVLHSVIQMQWDRGHDHVKDFAKDLDQRIAHAERGNQHDFVRDLWGAPGRAKAEFMKSPTFLAESLSLTPQFAREIVQKMTQ